MRALRGMAGLRQRGQGWDVTQTVSGGVVLGQCVDRPLGVFVGRVLSCGVVVQLLWNGGRVMSWREAPRDSTRRPSKQSTTQINLR
jgi:hypothetical protein